MRGLLPALALSSSITLLSAVPAWCQAEITALAEGLEPRSESSDVTVSRFADFAEEDQVEVGTQLEVGDLMASVSGKTDVELSCGENTVLRFSGGFRVVINPPGDTDCAVNFLSGELDVVTDQPTEIRAGGVILGSEGTQFAVQLVRQDGVAEEKLTVFDGKVRLHGETADGRSLDPGRPVESGETWQLKGGKAEWSKVSAEDIDYSARVHARFEVVKQLQSMPANDPAGISSIRVERPDAKALYAQLHQAHAAVLQKPDDSEARVELARLELAGKSDHLAAYHLTRAGITETSELEDRGIKIDSRLIQKYQSSYQRKQAPGGEAGGGQQRPPSTEGSQQRPQTTAGSQVTLPRYDARIATSVTAGSDVTRAWQLLDQKKWSQAVSAFAQLNRAKATARGYCGLAQAYGGLDGWINRRAYGAAAKALALHKDGDSLPAAELRTCQILNDIFLER